MHCCMFVSVCLLCLLVALSFPSLIDPMHWQQVKTINFFFHENKRKKKRALQPPIPWTIAREKKRKHTPRKKKKRRRRKKKKWQPNSSPIPP